MAPDLSCAGHRHPGLARNVSKGRAIHEPRQNSTLRPLEPVVLTEMGSACPKRAWRAPDDASLALCPAGRAAATRECLRPRAAPAASHAHGTELVGNLFVALCLRLRACRERNDDRTRWAFPEWVREADAANAAGAETRDRVPRSRLGVQAPPHRSDSGPIRRQPDTRGQGPRAPANLPAAADARVPDSRAGESAPIAWIRHGVPAIALERLALTSRHRGGGPRRPPAPTPDPCSR
jgi:hypothetical protein